MPKVEPAGRPQSTERRIAEGALALLRSKGPTAVTIEAVSTLTGMARTTIYRRYKDRNEMLAAAVEPITEPDAPAPSSDSAALLLWLVEQSLRSVDPGIGLGGIAALLTDADPEFTELIRSVLLRHRASLAQVVRERMDSGDVRADLEVEVFLDSIIGAYFAEQARTGAVADDWAEGVARTLLAAFVA